MPIRRRYGLKRKAPKVRRARFYKRRAIRNVKRYGNLYVERKWGCIQFGSTGTVGQITTGEQCSALGLVLGQPELSCFGSDLYDVPFTLKFALSYCLGYLDFAQMFDAYKLLNANVRLQTTLTAGTQTTVPLPFIEYLADYDSSSPLSVQQFQQKMGIKTKYFNANRPAVSMSVRPRVIQVLEQSNGNYNGLSWGKKNVWIDMANPNIEHYGIMGVIRNVYLPNGPSQQSLFTLDVHQKALLRDVQ